MEAFHLKFQSPVELLSCRKTSAIQQSVIPTHCCSKTKLATQRLCNKNLITTTTTTLTPSQNEALTSTSDLTAATTTTTATTTVRTLTTITNTSSLSISTSLSGNSTHIPIRLRRRLPLLTSIYEQKQKQRQQQQQQHLIRKCHNLWSCLYWRHNLTCIMMTMLFLISIVLSGNTALAAQRESFKPKDANNPNNNANTIYNEISSSSNSGSSSNSVMGGGSGGAGTSMGINNNGNGNAISHSNNNNISNGNKNVITTTSLSTSTSTSASSSSATASGLGYATTTSTHTTSSTSSSSSSGSSSTSSNSHKSSSSNRNSIDLQETTQNGPYFDKAASKNVTALLGKTAYLNCRVKNLGNKTMLLQVSWVRHRDIHLLTVGRYTYTSDQRFRAIHQPQTEDWILQIKYPQHRDSGIYECQVSTTPHMSHYIHLNVVEPSTEIIGAPDLYIESGSTINLTCVILNSPEPPAYIFWNHNNAIINYDSPRGGVSVVTNKGETTTSFLLIKSARPSDSGHYQCNPSNAKPKSVTVHVLNGEFPAAMQRAGLAHHRMSQNRYILVYLLMYLFTLASVRHYTRLPPAIVHGRKSLVM